jgi:exopolysaccharide production protein ExoZ
MEPDKRPVINVLQAGRGIAALAVVFTHSSLAVRDFGGIAMTPLGYGYLGVDFFFVLSGFIIFHSTVDRDRTITQYAIARFRRVYLPYWPIGLLMALAYVAMHKPIAWLPTLTLLPVDPSPALKVAWTLQHEILFYVLFGLFYYSGLLWFGLVIWLLCIIGGLPHLPFERINAEFFFGIAATVLFRRREAHWILFFGASVAVLIWVILGAGEEMRVIMGAAFAMIIAPLAQLERADRFRVPRIMVLLGAASYSLYLVHTPIIDEIGRIVPGWFILPAAVSLSLVAGFGYHFIVEVRAVSRRANPEVVTVGG